MTPRDAMAFCEELARSMELPQPFDLAAFLATLAGQRGKPIRATATRLGPGAPSGLLISTHAADHIFYPDDTSPLQTQQIVLHELGHLLLNHGVLGAEDHEVVNAIGRLLPGSPSTPARNARARSSYGDTDEVQAELFATLVALRATAPRPSRRAALAIQVAYRGLEPLWRLLVDAVPEVHLDVVVPVADDEVRRYQLYRRVLEIRDAQLALRAYIPAGARESALATARRRNLPDRAAVVLVEATELALALAYHRRGAPVADLASRTAPQPASPRLLEDAAWLLRVVAVMQRLGPSAGAATGLGRALVLPSVPGRPRSAS